MVHFEVSLRPSFKSRDHYEVLGCDPSSSKEELTEAYRNLSWKYHPQNRPDDAEAMEIFTRLGEAYNAIMTGDGGEAPKGLTAKQAKWAYEKRFGRFRKLYYDEGGIVGLPYAFALKEQLGAENGPPGYLDCGKMKVGFFRGFYLKFKMDWVLATIEVLLTAGSVGACVLYYLAIDENYEWYINVIGGVGLLLASCLLSFWYGFTRYPLLLEDDFASWLQGNSQRKDMEEIRNVCSEYYHGDTNRRSQTCALLFCAPLLAMDQLTSSLSVVILSLFLIPLRMTVGVSANVDSFLWGLAKSIGAVMSALAYYAIWILGNDVAKYCVVGMLLLNQALYTAILCKMDAVEFLMTLILRGAVSMAFVAVPPKNEADDFQYDVEVGCEPGIEDEWSDEGTQKSRSFLSVNTGGAQQDISNTENGSGSDSGSTGASSTASSHDGEAIVAGCDTFAPLDISRSEGPKAVDFSGNIYSARLADQQSTEDESKSLADTISSLPSIFQGFKKKLEAGLMGSTPSIKEIEPDVPSFVRSGTALSALSKDDASLQNSTITDAPSVEKRGFFGAILQAPAQNESQQKDTTHSKTSDASEQEESLTIVGDVESSRGLFAYEDPKVTKSVDLPRPMSASTENKSEMDTVSIYQPSEGGLRRGEHIFQATTKNTDEKEAPPPEYASKMKNITRQEILDMVTVPEESSLGSKPYPKETASRSRAPATPKRPSRSRSKATAGGAIVEVPEHVNMIGMVGSVDEEDVTLTGFDAVSAKTPDRKPLRGRRPAPGKVDLPVESQFVF